MKTETKWELFHKVPHRDADDGCAAGSSRSWQANVAKLLSLPKGYRYGRKTLWEVHVERRKGSCSAC